MGLRRTFVGFSRADIRFYWLMLAWKANKRIDFNFADCQLEKEIDSENETYIKSKCRERIGMAGTFAALIGQDTRSKHKYVRWEIEVAKEKGCRMIGINLDGSRRMVDATCPAAIQDIGAIFVPFSQNIVAHALENYRMHNKGNWHYPDSVYEKLNHK